VPARRWDWTRRQKLNELPYTHAPTIELDREVAGRWIADIAELNVLLYAESKEVAA
jgi:hypothetical protein